MELLPVLLIINSILGFVSGNQTTTVSVEVPTGISIPSKGKSIGEGCESDRECHLSEVHSTCADGLCVCERGFHPSLAQGPCLKTNATNGEDKKPSEESQPSRPKFKPEHMLPIMIVMGLMFVGMCVALNLFSRARFQNNRSIFNSPHPRLMTANLGDKKKQRKKRRSSHQSLSISQQHPQRPPGTGTGSPTQSIHSTDVPASASNARHNVQHSRESHETAIIRDPIGESLVKNSVRGEPRTSSNPSKSSNT